MKAGSTAYVRKPARYVGRTGQAVSIEDMTEQQVPVTIYPQFGVDMQVSSADMKLSLDNFAARHLVPAVKTIANKLDRDCLFSMYRNTANTVGTPGTVPNSLNTYLTAGALMNEEAAPVGDRNVVIAPRMQSTIVNALTGLFQAGDQISRQYKTGQMGTSAGFDWYMDQNVVTHTVGPLGGTPVVNGASQTGSSVITNGWTAAAANRLKAGDVVTFAGCNAVNPQNRQSTGQLRQFVVTADVNSDGFGNATIPISPAIVTSGQFQNVTGSPTNGGSVTVLGAASTATPQGIAFHPDSYTFGTVDLDVPSGSVEMGKFVRDDDTGLSIRFVQQYNISTDQWISRLDVLYFIAPIYPELACRIAS